MRCRTKFCRGRVGANDRSPYCPKCKAVRWKGASPIGYFFHKLRTSANRRGKPFTLTRQKFAELWQQGLGDNHGRTALCFSVDRIRNEEGYHDNNVQLKTVSENARRQFVPFFKDKATEEAAIAEVSQQFAEAYPELSAP